MLARERRRIFGCRFTAGKKSAFAGYGDARGQLKLLHMINLAVVIPLYTSYLGRSKRIRLIKSFRKKKAFDERETWHVFSVLLADLSQLLYVVGGTLSVSVSRLRLSV